MNYFLAGFFLVGATQPPPPNLPTLREFQELTEESREIVEKEVGPMPIAGTVAELADPEFIARQKASTEASESFETLLRATLQQLSQPAKKSARGGA